MRGDIHELRSDRRAVGHEQSGNRYAVVVQNPDLLLSTVVVAPTSTRARDASFRPVIDIAGTATAVLVEQLAAVDQVRLGAHVGVVSALELDEIDGALRDVLDLR